MAETKQTAIAKPYDIVKEVQKTLQVYAEKGELVLPSNYSFENALKSAWLVLQETVNKDKVPVLQSCSQSSIANALLDMAVQGLNPGKKQCYFIAYGTKLLCQRSYFGTMAVAQEVAKATDIWAEVVYDGDVFEYEITHNRKTVSKHTQKLENIGKDIVAAYCVIEFSNEKPSHTEIMTIEQIHKSWEKSRMKGVVSTHTEFPDEMCKRTVISRACKKFINASSDENLLKHFNRSDEEQTETEVAEEIEENANGGILEIESVTPEATSETTTNPKVTEEKQLKRDPKTIKTIAQMFNACEADYGLDEKAVCKELGVAAKTDIVDSPANCYLQIASIWGPGPEQEDGPGF